MKRYGNLWDELVSFTNLLTAAQSAGSGKRRIANVAKFQFHLERELARLQSEIVAREYRPGSYRTFEAATFTRIAPAAWPRLERFVKLWCRLTSPPDFASWKFAHDAKCGSTPRHSPQRNRGRRC